MYALAQILRQLQQIRTERGSLAYEVFHELLNACDYGGVPQNRNRIYIVGIHLDRKVAPFQWPSQKPMRSLCSILGPSKAPAGTVPTTQACARRNVALTIRSYLCEQVIYMFKNADNKLIYYSVPQLD